MTHRRWQPSVIARHQFDAIGVVRKSDSFSETRIRAESFRICHSNAEEPLTMV
jgi:hypothetical protein